MLRILIVEDDVQLATTLKYLVEDNPRYRVVATAEDADGAIAAAEQHEPDLVLLDLHLAHGSTGFSVAVRLNDLGVPCLFVSGKAPQLPDARPGDRLPDEAVHRRRVTSFARNGRGPAARARGCPAETTSQSHAVRSAAPAEPRRAGLHSVQSCRSGRARTLDFRTAAPASLEAHVASARFAEAHGLARQPRAGIEQGLATALDVDVRAVRPRTAAVRRRRCAKRALDESGRCAASDPASISKPA